MRPRRARLVLADDHHLMVEGLQRMLQPQFKVVGIAYSGDELLQLLRAVEPDCLLLDLSMPGRNGLQLLPDITALRPRLRILVVTMHLDWVLAESVLQAGAHGFIPKDSPPDELREAIATVIAGYQYLSPRVPQNSHRLSLRAPHPGVAQLTSRQQQILRLVGRGKSSAQIADTIGLSERTVSFHRANIRKVLGIDSEQGLLRYAILVEIGLDERKVPRRHW